MSSEKAAVTDESIAMQSETEELEQLSVESKQLQINPKVVKPTDPLADIMLTMDEKLKQQIRFKEHGKRMIENLMEESKQRYDDPDYVNDSYQHINYDPQPFLGTSFQFDGVLSPKHNLSLDQSRLE